MAEAEATQESTTTTPTIYPGQEWFTVAEAAVYVRCSWAAFRQQMSRGKIKADSPARPGFREHRFRRGTLDAWLMSGLTENDNGSTK